MKLTKEERAHVERLRQDEVDHRAHLKEEEQRRKDYQEENSCALCTRKHKDGGHPYAEVNMLRRGGMCRDETLSSVNICKFCVAKVYKFLGQPQPKEARAKSQQDD